jgi:hypothetical protein
MKTDETLVLLERENPIHEGKLPTPRDPEAQALKERVLLGEIPDASGFAARPRPRRGLVLPAAIAAGTACAIGAGLVIGLPGEGVPEPASAVERAAAALEVERDAILHTVERKTLRTVDGTRVGVVETWSRLSPPYDYRRVDGIVGRGREFASVDGRLQIYNPLNNTIGTLAPGVKSPEARGPMPPAGPPIGRVGSKPGEPLHPLTGLRDQILPLLRSGDAREAGRTTIDGREGIRIVSRRFNIGLVVDAKTYLPIQWRMVGENPPGVEITRLEVYERLPATQENLALLSLRRQHPDAKLDPGAITIAPDPPGK